MDFPTWAAPRRATFDAYLEDRFLDAWPSSFAEPLRYALFGGGKRFRPLMVLAAYEALAENPEDLTPALPLAAAIELVHTYSLVHDDLPSMDDDDERRGRPTLHKKWDEAMAILVGDALLTEAFLLVTEAPLSDHVCRDVNRRLSGASGYRGMVGGQVADIQWSQSDWGMDELLRLHAMKTGALITFAAEAGALAAGATDDQVNTLSAIGKAVGLAFQLADDVLDEEEDAGADGTPSFLKFRDRTATLNHAQEVISGAIEQAATLPRPDALVGLALFCVNRSH